jgi:hypothetical protein
MANSHVFIFHSRHLTGGFYGKSDKEEARMDERRPSRVEGALKGENAGS